MKGDASCLLMRSAAVIGSREAASETIGKAAYIGEFLARHGFCVVSGLALGCDTGGHTGALRGGGKTVAVLAHGLAGSVYPPQNQTLADDILTSGGALVSEYPPAGKPTTYTFVQRDRLQSALSDAVVVVQTTTDGGSMHAVKACLGDKRTLAVWLPEPLPRDVTPFSGNLDLVRRGAMKLTTPSDLANLCAKILGTPRIEPSLTVDRSIF